MGRLKMLFRVWVNTNSRCFLKNKLGTYEAENRGNLKMKANDKIKDNSLESLHYDNRDTSKAPSDLTEKEKHVPEDSITTTKSKIDRSNKISGKRGRGKVDSGSTVNKKSKNTSDVLDLLNQKVSSNRIVASKCTSDDSSTTTIPNNIDLEVFAALPSDIRDEILKSHNGAFQNSTSSNKPSLPPPTSSKTNLSLLNDSDFQPSTSKAAQLKQQTRELRKQENLIATSTIPKTTMQNLDPEFLAALPQDLRIEIEKEYAHIPIVCEPTLHHHKDIKTSKGIVEQFADSQKVSPDNIFMQENCKQLLLAWLKSADVPETYDVDLIAVHAGELVNADDIDRLYTPLIYFCRLLNQQKRGGAPSDCLWHTAYLRIIKSLQKEMENSYNGRHLFLGEKLKCDNCLKST